MKHQTLEKCSFLTPQNRLDQVLHIPKYTIGCAANLTASYYTATSSPKESGRLSAFRTLWSRGAASTPNPSAGPQLSRSSLSSVLDSYSEPRPDSLKRRSSSAPKTRSPSRELSSLGVSPMSWLCSWLSAALAGKRKHSSRTPLLPST